jgi:ParB-like chromosome segregation protein Spo0J
MGDLAATLSQPDVFYLPEQLGTEPLYQRPTGFGDEELEAKKVEKLADAIDRDGQLDSALIIPGKEPGDNPILLAGHRRRRAIALINEKRSALPGAELLRIRCRMIDPKSDLKRIVITSNVQREGYTPLELGQIIKECRQEHQWGEFAGAKKVAQYLGISSAQVTQHEKLLTAPPEIQSCLKDGTLTAQSAFDMLDVKKEKQSEVLKRAEEIQREKSQRLTPKALAARKEKGIENRLENPAIKKAIRETPGASDSGKLTPLSKKDLLEAIEAFDSPAYGKIDGAVRQWASYFVGTYAKGGGTVATMRKKFDAMTSKASKGTKAEPKPPADEPKTKPVKVAKTKMEKVPKKKAASKKKKPTSLATDSAE